MKMTSHKQSPSHRHSYDRNATRLVHPEYKVESSIDKSSGRLTAVINVHTSLRGGQLLQDPGATCLGWCVPAGGRALHKSRRVRTASRGTNALWLQSSAVRRRVRMGSTALGTGSL